MRIKSLHLINFKRFTKLEIASIADDCKLVLLIGANGSGKSSIFDAFEFVSRNAKRGNYRQQSGYYQKRLNEDAVVSITTSDGDVIERIGDTLPQSPNAKRFFGRSSVRIVPRATAVNSPENQLLRDADGPEEFILPDQRFNTDLQLYVSTIDSALREAFIAQKLDEAPEVRAQQIEPLNEALLRVFGVKKGLAPQLVNWESAEVGKGAQLIFLKGDCRISYDLLSHGEKQVVILLLNFLVRRKGLDNQIIFIDEMDNHLHRDVQFRLLQEIVEHWIPESSQLWTATHALGFIEYASKALRASVIDLDELDFDQPQSLMPMAKDDQAVFDIAISPQLLAELASNKTVLFVEGATDKRAFDRLITDAIFLEGGNKQQAFFKAKAAKMLCLLDGDLLTLKDKEALKSIYPFVRFLASYCIENEFYHPDNVAELALTKKLPFDRDKYIRAWCDDFDAERPKRLASVGKVRTSYKSIFPEIEKSPFADREVDVVRALTSSNFDDFYPLFSAKDFGASAKQLLDGWATSKELLTTVFFANRIKESLK